MSSNSFYLIEDGKETGPFDMLLMIKKIRNGKIKPSDLVYVQGSNTPQKAADVPELRPYFDKSSPENSTAKPVRETASHGTDNSGMDLSSMLKDAWVFFGDNQSASLVAGSMALAAIAFNLALAELLPAAVSAVIACTSAAMLMFLLMSYMYRKMEGETSDPMFFRQLFTLRGADYGICAFIAGGLPLGIPAAIGASLHPLGYLLMLPGALFFSLFIFAPLLILSNLNYRAIDALTLSMGWMKSQGFGTILNVASLVALNLLAITVFFVPVFVSLPITSIVLVDLFRQRMVNDLPTP